MFNRTSICPNCSQPLKPDLRFCPNCGSKLEFKGSKGPINPQPPTESAPPTIPPDIFGQPFPVAPGQTQSPTPIVKEKRATNKLLAIVLEILPGLFGFLGFGWIYARRLKIGLVLLVSWWIVILLTYLFIGITAGFGSICLFVMPAIPIVSAIILYSKIDD